MPCGDLLLQTGTDCAFRIYRVTFMLRNVPATKLESEQQRNKVTGIRQHNQQFISVLAFSTQVPGFKPGRSRRNFRAKEILSTPSFGGEVKPSVPCRSFAACKRSLNLRGSRNLGNITRHRSRPRFHLSLLGSLASLRTYRHLVAKV